MNWQKALKGSLLTTGLVVLSYYIPLLIEGIILQYLSGGALDTTWLYNHATKYFVGFLILGLPPFVYFAMLFAFLFGILKIVYDILNPPPEKPKKEKKPKEKKKEKKKEEEEWAPPSKRKEEEPPPPIPIDEFQSISFDWSG